MTEPNSSAPNDPQSNLPPDEAGDPTGVGRSPASAPPSPVAAKKRRRRVPIWLKGIGVLVLLLILLVLFAPTIAGTGPVRSFVLGKVNENLNGRVEVADWSFGWMSGLKLNGVRVLDAAGGEVLSLASMTTQLTVLDLARGNYSLGDAVIDGLNFNLRREADGQMNIAKLAKAAPASPAQAEPAPTDAPKPADSAAPAAPATKLPNLSGNIAIRNSKGSFEDVAKKQTVQFPSIEGDVKIPDINQPIENALTVVAAAADGQKGTLKIGGTVDVIENNEVRIEAANVDEKIEITGLGMPAIAALMPPGTIDAMQGNTNGTMTVKLTAGQGGHVEAQVTSDGFAASGPALKGDTLKAKQFVVTVPRTTIDMSSGFGSWTNWPIRTGGDKAQPIKVALVHADHEDAVTLGVNATPQSLMNLADNLKPAATGRLDLGVNVDVGALAKQLPNVFPERDGRRLTSAKLAHVMRVDLTPERANLAPTIDLKDIALVNADGSTVTLEPIHAELTAGTLGGGWAMPDLRDIRLAVNSGFAKAEFSGKEVSNLSGTATGDLARTQAELGQFIPMDDMKLGGTFAVELNSSGDFANATAPAKLAATATLTNLTLDGVAGLERFQQGHTRFEAGADVRRSEAGIQELRDVRIVARTGRSEQALTLDAELTALVNFVDTTKPNPATGKPEMVRSPQVPEYAIRKLTADLAAVQRDFPAQFASLNEQGLQIESGVLALTGSGSYKADAIAFDLKGGVNDLDLTRVPPITATASAALAQVPPAPENVAVLRDYNLSLDAAGSYLVAGTSATTRLTRLQITDSQKMIALAKGKEDLVIATGGAGVQPSGEIRLGADLKKLNDVKQAFSAEPAILAADGKPQGAQLESGRLSGSLQLGPAAQGLMALNGRLDLTNLTVRTEAEPIENEKVAIVLKLRSKSDFSYLNVDEVTATGRLVNAKVRDTVIDLGASDAPNAPPLAMVPQANAVIELPNLRDLHALLRAISPPEPPPAAPNVAVAPPARDRATAGAADDARRDDGRLDDASRGDERRGGARSDPPARQPRGDDVIGRDVIGRRPDRQATEPRRALPAGPADPDGSVTMAPADDAPAPPAHLQSGTATIKLALAREGGQMVLTPDVAIKDLSFQAGTVSKKVGDVSFSTAMRLVPAASAAADASFIQRVRELTIPTLVLRGAGAEISLEKPLVVKDPSVAFAAFGSATTRPSDSPRPPAEAALSAVLNGKVDLAELFSVLEAWQGAEPGKLYPYAGSMTLRQELATAAGGVFRLVGRADVNDFTMTGEGGSKFAEPRLGFGNTITLDSSANILKIENLALAMETTKAVQMTVTGAIHEFDTRRRFENTVAKLDYDAKVLWDVLRPMMDPETGGKSLEEVTVAGKRVSEFKIEGSYPAEDPSAIRSLRVNGGFALETLAARGLTVEDLDLRFLLEQGILLIQHAAGPASAPTPPSPADGELAAATPANEPPGARCNQSGVLSFHDLTIDLTGEHVRLNAPNGHRLLRNVTINPVVADSLIGRFVNPAFAGADQAKGILDVTIESCQGLALDDAMQSPDPAVSGRAELRWSLSDLFLGQPQLVAFVAKLKPNALNENGFQGSIKDGKIVLEGGQVYSDMTFNIDEYALGFNGGIGLAENKLVNFSVGLPPSLFAAIDDKFERVVPAEGYKLALTGTTDNWIQNATRSIGPIIADLGVRSAVGGLLNRESDREKKTRRQREREAREARERGETMPAKPDAPAPGDAAAPAGEPGPDDVIGRPREPAGEEAPAAEAEPDDPLGNLLDKALGGDRETDAEKKARREKVRKERREREERERQQREQPQPAPQ